MSGLADGNRTVYEIMNPVIINKDEAKVTFFQGASSVLSPTTPSLVNIPKTLRQDSSAGSLTDLDELVTTTNDNIMMVCQSANKGKNSIDFLKLLDVDDDSYIIINWNNL